MPILETVGECIERNETYFANELCTVFENHRISFGQFAVRARRLADGLYRAGLRSQDRVSVISANRPEFVDLYGACEWAGYVISPLNTELAAPEIAFILNDAEPRILVFERRFAATIDSLRDRLQSIETYICLGEAVPPWAVSYEAVVASGSAQGPPMRSRPGDQLALFYTSGTTGQPKGAVHTHAQQIAFAMGRVIETGCTLGDKALIPIPLFHTAARSTQLSHHLRSAAAVLLHRADPGLMLQTIELERITLVSVAPTVLQMMLDHPDIDRYDLTSLKTIVYAGAPMPLPLLERGLKKFGPVFMCIYAQTESAGTCLRKQHHVLTGSPEQLLQLKSVGQPYLGTQLRIVDDHDQEMLRGQTGEVCFKADNVISGYWRNEVATRDALRDGWFHTGDMGYIDDDGFLFLVDRKKDMIIVGGNNVYSREVEDALHQHPAVEHCAVIGIPNPIWGEAVRAVVVRRENATADERELINFCEGLIGRYKCPSSVVFAAELPKLATGKINKPALRERYGGAASTGTHKKPVDRPLESDAAAIALVTRIWEAAFKRSPIKPDESFFELGGNSLLGVQLSLEIQSATGRDLPAFQFYETPTIAGTVALLAATSPKRYSPLVKLRDGDPQRPLFIIHGRGGGSVSLTPLANQIDWRGTVYGLQAQGFGRSERALSQVEDMAKSYLDAVRSLQTAAPFHLIGFSFGGLVAIEMMRLLLAEGEPVCRPILIDTAVHINRWPQRQWHRFMLQWIEQRKLEIADLPAAQREAFGQLIDRIAAHHLQNRQDPSASGPGVGPRDIPPELAELSLATVVVSQLALMFPDLPLHKLRDEIALPPPALRVHEACGRAQGRYLPTPLPTSVDLIECAMLRSGFFDLARFWSRYFVDLDVRIVPGDHNSLLKPNFVDKLGAAVSDLLATREAGASPLARPAAEYRCP